MMSDERAWTPSPPVLKFDWSSSQTIPGVAPVTLAEKSRTASINFISSLPPSSLLISRLTNVNYRGFV